MANEKNDEVMVYYLGYPGVNNVVVTLVGNQPYGSPVKADGKPDIGAPISVRRGDLATFMKKNQYYDATKKELRVAYTTDPQMAALVKSGGKTGAALTQDVGSILSMMTPEQLREQLELLEIGQAASSDPSPINQKAKPK